MTGVHWDLDEQLAWLTQMTADYYAEVAELRRYNELASARMGPGYGPIESQVLHCFVRTATPERIVEVGGGMSTLISVEAARANGAESRGETSITTVEPFPNDALAELDTIRLIREPAQTVSLEVFEGLRRGDLLFIDSTHTVKTGSEVLRLYLEIVPVLASGVVIHVHDITLPYLYAPDVLSTYFDWQETSLVLAVLTGNERLRVRCCLSALHHDRTEALQGVLSDYRPRSFSDGIYDGPDGYFPSSLWLEVQ
jgi:predicted O-methyltransferase YrrM